MADTPKNHPGVKNWEPLYGDPERDKAEAERKAAEPKPDKPKRQKRAAETETTAPAPDKAEATE